MKIHQTILVVSSVVAIAGLGVSTFAKEEKEEVITIDKVPAAVKQALAAYAKDSEVKKIELSSEDGKKAYEFDIEQGSNKFEVTLSKKGKFLGKEEEIQLTDMPAAAQAALKTQAGSGQLSSFEKAEDAKHKITYEGVIEKDGKKKEVAVDEDGKLVSTEDADKD